MTDHEFFFAIEICGRPPSDDMLRDLVSKVLGQAGCAAGTAPAVVDALESAVTKSASQGDASCTLTFRATEDQLAIAVSTSSGHLWQTTHPIS